MGHNAFSFSGDYGTLIMTSEVLYNISYVDIPKLENLTTWGSDSNSFRYPRYITLNSC